MSNYVKISTLALARMTIDAADPECASKLADTITNALSYVLCDKPDLIVMPELCDRPKGDNTPYFMKRDTTVLERLSRIAADNRCYIVYPTLTMPDEHFRNASIMIDRNGEVMGEYHKIYPVASEMEVKGIRAGKGPVVFDCDFGRVGCAICFDMCFRELATEYRKLNIDVLAFSSAYHGGLVRNWWAYDSLSHLVASSTDLPSGIINPVGMQLASTTNYAPYVTANVNLDCIATFLGLNRHKLLAAKQKYGDKLRIDDPGHLGAVLFSSETDEFTAKDIMEEYGIEPVRTYFDRIRALRENYIEE